MIQAKLAQLMRQPLVAHQVALAIKRFAYN